MRIVFGVADRSIELWHLIENVEIMINGLTWRGEVPPARVVWVDSGGYQAMVKGVRLELREVVARYRELDAHLYMSLDQPPRRLCPRDPALVKLNISNYEELRALVDKEIVPVVHCYDPELMLEAVDCYRSLGAKVIAYGGAVPPSMGRMGRGSRLIPIIALAIVVKAGRLPVHVLGLGGANTMYAVLSRIGAASFDSSAWRIKAAYGKVIVPGLGERYVGDRRVKFGRTALSREEYEVLRRGLEKTGFPYIDRLDELLKTFRGRALINAWILFKFRDVVAPRNGMKWLVGEATRLASMPLSELIEVFYNRLKMAVDRSVAI